MRIRGGIHLAVLVVASTAARAQAQWVVTPYLGINIGGDAEFRRGGPGGSVGYVGSRLGFEVDFQRYLHFFKDENVAPEGCGGGPTGAPCIDLDTDAMGFMGNVVAPIRIEGAKSWRPYATAGLGVIHAWFDAPGDDDDTDQSDLAFNLGGGVMYSRNPRVGFRGDLRYFRALVDESQREGGYFKDYGYWRATVGVTFGFPR
jgi:Outer membrane protein beta-barrel domain